MQRGRICDSALPLSLMIVILRMSVNVCIKEEYSRVPYLGTNDILEQIILCYGRQGAGGEDCPVHSRCFAASLASTH